MNTPLHSRALLRHIRFDEVFVLQGTPLMGALFSMDALTIAHFETLMVFLIGSILLVAHVFTLNDWADIAHGLKAADPQVSSLRLFWFSLFLLFASLLVFALIDLRVVILGVIVAVLGFFYSHPKLNFKGTPIASSLPHLIGGLFHFLLGYAVFTPIDQRGIFIALFFALTFAAGHLNHEVRDFDLDQKNRARTNAVAFGKRATFVAGLILFTCAYLCLFLLGWFRLVPRPLSFLAAVFYLLHLYWSLRALRSQLNPDTLDRFQVQYRSLYAVIGISILCFLFYK
ncbi:MAG TPA: UbiA family prenyltransferase [Chthoniobacterales bacterium]|jgi:4-hydroxybenzoate polyprenyltransferase|nr:UbiA family prenyltransferase [Chthoniobacterales bacterium]